MKRKYNVGDVYPTNCGVYAQIIGIADGIQRVKIKWLDNFGHECIVKSTHLSVGKVYNPYAKIVCGVGFMGVGPYSGKEHKKQHDLWGSVLTRVYSELNLNKKPTYRGCSVTSEWHNFQTFAAWCEGQKGFGEKGYQLDKDILFIGNKEYSPMKCRFVPAYVNTCLGTSAAIRGNYPLGVYNQHPNCPNPYTSSIKDGRGVKKHLGLYDTPLKAHIAWQIAKALRIESVVGVYSKEAHFDTEIADALMSRVWNLRLNACIGIETLTL